MLRKFQFVLIVFLTISTSFMGVRASHADSAPRVLAPRVLAMAGVADFYLPDLIGALEKELDAQIVFESFPDTQSTIQSVLESKTRPDIIYVEAMSRDARLHELGKVISASDVPNLGKIKSKLVENPVGGLNAGIIEIPFQWYTLGVLWNKGAISLNVPRGVRFSIQDVTQPEVLRASSACKIGVVDHPQVIATLLEEATWSDWRVSPEHNGAHIAHSKATWMQRLRTTLTRQPQDRMLRNLVRGDICAVVTYSYFVTAMHRLNLYKDDIASDFGFTEFSGPTPLLVDRLVINKNSSNLDLAFRAADWLLSDESQSRIASTLGTRPVTSSANYKGADVDLSQGEVDLSQENEKRVGNEKRVDDNRSARSSFFYAAKASPGRDAKAGDTSKSFNLSWTSIPLAK